MGGLAARARAVSDETGPALLRLPDRLRLLCIGAHADDLEIGAGGTVLRLVAEGRVAAVGWVVLAAHGVREAEARAGAEAVLEGVADRSIELARVRDGYFPADWAAVKDRFEALKARFEPDLVLTHRRDDLHQDHRVVGELTWNTFRHHPILEYEIPKYDADLAAPNVLVELPEAVLERKIGILDGDVPLAGRPDVVHAGHVPRAGAAARDRGGRAERLRRGILRPEDRPLATRGDDPAARLTPRARARPGTLRASPPRTG